VNRALPRKADDGVSLVELLMAIAIMSIAFVAILGAFGTSVIASDIHRKDATGDTLVRSLAETIKNEPYRPGTVACASYGSSFAVPGAYNSPTVTIEYWNGAAAKFTPTCGDDSGVQRVTIAIASKDGRGQETTQILKRCDLDAVSCPKPVFS